MCVCGVCFFLLFPVSRFAFVGYMPTVAGLLGVRGVLLVTLVDLVSLFGFIKFNVPIKEKSSSLL